MLTSPLPELANLTKTQLGKTFRLARVFAYVSPSVQDTSAFVVEVGGDAGFQYLDKFFMTDAEFKCETIEGIVTGFVEGYLLRPDTGSVHVPSFTLAKEPKFVRDYGDGAGKFIVSYHTDKMYSRMTIKKAEKVHGVLRRSQSEPQLFAWGPGFSP